MPKKLSLKKDNLGAAEGITLKKGIRARVALEKADNFGKSFGKKDKKIDRNIRFILGPCNPVIVFPGLYGTKLMFKIQCHEFQKNKKP